MSFVHTYGSSHLYCDLTFSLEFNELKLHDTTGCSQTFIESCDFSPDATKLLMCNGRGYLIEHDLKSKDTFSWKAHSAEIWRVRYSQDGKRICSCSSDRLIRVWFTSDKRLHSSISGHMDTVWTCFFLPTPGKLISCSSDHCIIIWDYQRELVSQNVRAPNSQDTEVGENPEGAIYQLRPADVFVKGHKPIPFSHFVVNILNGHKNVIENLAVSRSGKYLVSCSRDKTICLWRNFYKKTDTKHAILRGHRDRVLSCTFAPHRDHMMASTSGDRTIIIWNLKSRTILWQLEGHRNIVWASSFLKRKSNLMLISCSSDHSVKVWDVTTGIELWTTKELDDKDGIPPQILYCTTSADQRMIAITTSTGKVFIAHID